MPLRRTLLPAFALAALTACGDDVQPASSEGGGGAAPATTTGAGGDPSSGGGGQGGGTGGEGAGEPRRCTDGLSVDAWSARWEPFTVPGFAGHDGFAPAVHDLAVDADGSVVAVGRFQWHERERVPPVLRLRDGAWEPARATWELEPPLDGFSAVAIGPDGALALATNDSFGERDGAIWIDEGDGLRVIAELEGQVRTLAFWGGRLWVAGLFTLEGDAPIEGLAVWDGTTWSAAPGGPLVAAEPGAAVFELLAEEAGLTVAGAFSGIGGVPAANVATYDGTGWTALDLDDAMVVYALARTESGVLHAGGALGPLEAAGGVARWTGATWEIVGGGLAQYATRGVVTDLVALGDGVAATGCFSTAGGLMGEDGTTPAQSVALWDGAAWRSLDDGDAGVLAPWFQPFVCGDEGLSAVWDVPHQRLATDGERLILGGYFAGVDGVQSQSIAVHDGTAWRAQGESGFGIGGSIDRIVAGGPSCEVVGLGTFTHVAGEPVDGRAVRWTDPGWQVLPDPLPRDAFCVELDIARSGTLAVGCTAFPPEGDVEGVILTREGDALVARDVELPGGVTAVRWARDVLWVAGDGPTSWIGRLDGDVLTVVADDLDAPANHLQVIGDDDVVVAGSFSHVGGVEALRIARWDGEAWSALGEGLPGQVTALGRDGDAVWVSTYDEGAGALLLGRFDLDRPELGWREQAGPETGVTPQSFFSLNAIRPAVGGLFVGGTVEMDDGSGRGVLRFADGSFRAIDGGVGAIGIGGLSVSTRGIWVAGVVGEAGAGDGRVSSVGVARFYLEPTSAAP